MAIQGGRAVVKSTLLRSIAAGVGAHVLDRDDLGTRAAVTGESGTAHEWPVTHLRRRISSSTGIAAPAASSSPGRPAMMRFRARRRHLTGRLHVTTISPLSQVELVESGVNLIPTLRTDPNSAATVHRSRTDRLHHVERVVASGFPMALARSGAAGSRWLNDCIESTLRRDLRDLARITQPVSLATPLARLANQSAQILNITNAARAAGLEERTANGYVRLLEALFLVHRLPAWGRTLNSRSTAMPKVHLVDSGVAARLLRLTPEKLARLTPTALTDFGHLLETFVVNELLAQASWVDDIAAFGHWRTHSGAEDDLVLETHDGQILAFEVKAAGRVTGRELSGLRALRELIGVDFVAGVALYRQPVLHRRGSVARSPDRPAVDVTGRHAGEGADFPISAGPAGYGAASDSRRKLRSMPILALS